MRVGGAFPLNYGGAYPLTLVGGGFTYIPYGNYIFQLGTNTVMQYYDPLSTVWRTVAAAGSAGAISVDGYNYRLLNTTSTTGVATITGAGSGATNGIGAGATGVTVTAQAAPAGGRTARYFAVVGGSLPALVVAQGGANFAVPPLILIDPPPVGGVQATAVCTLTAGAIATATLTNVGAGYTAIPNVYVIPQFLDYPGGPTFSYTTPPIPPNAPPGTLAGFIARNNWMTGLQLNNPLSGGALINFGASPVLGGSGTVTAVTLVDGGLGYTAAATTLTVTGAGAATATIANPVAAANDNSTLQAFVNE